jgi:hypothetical protein
MVVPSRDVFWYLKQPPAPARFVAGGVFALAVAVDVKCSMWALDAIGANTLGRVLWYVLVSTWLWVYPWVVAMLVIAFIDGDLLDGDTGNGGYYRPDGTWKW